MAQPWWVNLAILIPLGAYLVWRRQSLTISPKTLVLAALFGLGFGFVETAVVVYLRAAVGVLAGYGGTLAQVARLSSSLYQQAGILRELPSSLAAIEVLREAATLVMLVAVAFLSVKPARERWAIFFWTFAIWDLAYYAGLWATVRWPASLATPDVLFLIPVPWLAPVWFPILVSAFTVFAVLAARRSGAGER
ncbi:hypothetical protein HY573_00155 [Candidatus Parcubacteria bacterium]|nr:hypothetical protein [Candidatus Parcubacteria bacterium]